MIAADFLVVYQYSGWFDLLSRVMKRGNSAKNCHFCCFLSFACFLLKCFLFIFEPISNALQCSTTRKVTINCQFVASSLIVEMILAVGSDYSKPQSNNYLFHNLLRGFFDWTLECCLAGLFIVFRKPVIRNPFFVRSFFGKDLLVNIWLFFRTVKSWKFTSPNLLPYHDVRDLSTLTQIEIINER